MAIESIAKTLGAGSGIDIGALTTSLVDAQFAAKNKLFEQREEKLAAQISGVAKLKSAITGFDQALKTLIKGGTLRTRPVSADPAAIKASPLPGSAVADQQVSVTVTQLASPQASTTNDPVARDAAFRPGTLTLRFGRDEVDADGNVTGFTPGDSAVTIDITAADATLEGIATKINAANAGVTAALVNDGAGARLTIKGASGEAQAFEITGADSDPLGEGRSLATLDVGRTSTTTTTGTRARDAVVTMDGARFTRATNAVTDLIPGVKLELLKTTAAPVALTSAKPTAELTAAITDFVDTYNEMLTLLKEQNDPFSGALRTDTAVAGLSRSLARLTTTQLLPVSVEGAPRMLADLGVSTARDGRLSVDAARLAGVMTKFPGAVEEMFAEGATAASNGLSAALGAIAKRMTDKSAGLDASAATYAKQKANLAEAKAKSAEQATAYKDRLTRQFATMDARTAAYKSTQTFLDNQIKAWNRSDD